MKLKSPMVLTAAKVVAGFAAFAFKSNPFNPLFIFASRDFNDKAA